MYAHCNVQLIINGKNRAEAIEVDLSLAAKGLEDFKKHLLSETKLSLGEHEKYMLSYQYANYTVGPEEESKITTVFLPIMNDDDLRKYIILTVKI